MIKSLRIRNFQKHENLKIKFDPHVTTIIGPSDVGKSAIIRALRWVALNKPRGDSFLREGAEEVSITLRTTDHVIKRRRGKTNTYSLNGSKFTAFGSTVPDEIADVLNLSDLNFQGQHDPSGFWFAMSPGEVSRQLNSIVDLGSIDSTLSNLSAMLRKARTEEGLIEKRIEKARHEREELREAKKADRALKEVEGLAATSTEKAQWAFLLRVLLTRVSEHANTIKRAVAGLGGAQKAVKKGEAWAGLTERRERLSELVTKASCVLEDAAQEIPDISKLESRGNKYTKARRKRMSLVRCIEDLKRSKRLVKTQKKQKHDIEDEFHEMLGEICPMCGSLTQTPF